MYFNVFEGVKVFTKTTNTVKLFKNFNLKSENALLRIRDHLVNF